MLLLDAILGGKDVDIGRLISREIHMRETKRAGYLFFPCLIIDLYVKAGLEITKGEKNDTLLMHCHQSKKERKLLLQHLGVI